MGGVRCPYCHELSEDNEFCDFCGKSIDGAEQVESAQEEVLVLKKKWGQSVVSCHSTVSDYCPKRERFLKYADLIELPIKCEENEGKYILHFLDEGTVDLETWLNRKNKIEFKEAVNIIERVHKIVSELNFNEYILGSFDLSDFWMKDDDINTLRLRQIRPFIRVGSFTSNLKIGDFYAPEIKNEDLNNIGYWSDVFIIGKLLLTMLLWDRDLRDYAELRYLSHQIQLFSLDIPRELRYWVGKSTSIFIEDRYENAGEQFEALQRILEKNIERQDLIKNQCFFDHTEKSNVGLGKAAMISSENIEFSNEDSYLFLNGSEDINNALAIVADGISNCKYGSGYKASNWITNTAKELWEERSGEISSKERAEEFFKDLIKMSSEKIVDDALKDIPLNEEGKPEGHIFSSDIMGSTLAAVILIENKAYIASLGDSRIYLYHKEEGISLLNVDDNYINKCIKDNMTWSEIKTLENKSSLTKIVGGAETKSWPFTPSSVQVNVEEITLFEGETLMLCSDGVTDYITAIGHRTDEWNADFKIHQILMEESKENSPLDKIADRFIREANENGGGDNISVVLIKLSHKENLNNKL